MTQPDARQRPIVVEWTGDGLIGLLTIGGEHWASIEWSEKRRCFCIEDCEGQCLKHVGSLRGTAHSKEEAIALAKTMVRDGRLPTPEQARAEHEERRRNAREKRHRYPSEIRKREQAKRYSDAITAAWRASAEEDKQPPLYETLAEAFDFANPELWKSNSFASLRPRLILHLKAAIASIEHDLAFTMRPRYGGRSSSKEYRQAAIRPIEANLARAREILAQLASSGGDRQ